MTITRAACSIGAARSSFVRSITIASAILGAVISSTACEGSRTQLAVQPRPDVKGHLDVTWTVGQADTEDACTAAHATTFDLAVLDSDTGSSVADASADCGAFGMTVELAPGKFDVRAQLLDAAGKPVSRAVVQRGLALAPDGVMSVTIDIPSK